MGLHGSKRGTMTSISQSYEVFQSPDCRYGWTSASAKEKVDCTKGCIFRSSQNFLASGLGIVNKKQNQKNG